MSTSPQLHQKMLSPQMLVGDFVHMFIYAGAESLAMLNMHSLPQIFN